MLTHLAIFRSNFVPGHFPDAESSEVSHEDRTEAAGQHEAQTLPCAAF